MAKRLADKWAAVVVVQRLAQHMGLQTQGPSPSQHSTEPLLGRWRCQCGNVQTGSQCKDCNAKWWNVEWTREDPPPGPKSTPHKTDPPSHKPAEKQALVELDEFLHKLPPGDEAHT